jgi:ABC-type multidrug transport system ATPase subunit
VRLSIESVSKRYRGGVEALSDFTLDVGPGVLGLLGPNGAGKSTLMRIVATVTRPSSGRVTWDGADLAKDPDAIRRVLGYLPQDFGVYPNLTAREFLEYLAAAKGLAAKTAKARIGELLQLVNLSSAAGRRLAEFSGGMRQRVGIAQALLNDPRVLIVDEPTGGLDPEERVRFRNLLAELSGERVVILSTHIVSDVEDLCAQFAVINQGRLLLTGEPAALVNGLAGRIYSRAVDKADAEALKAQVQVVSTRLAAGRTVVRAYSETTPGEGFEPVPADLEDVYFCTIAGYLAPRAQAA